MIGLAKRAMRWLGVAGGLSGGVAGGGGLSGGMGPAVVATALISALIPALVSGSAWAQVAVVDPYWAVVRADRTPMRAGDFREYYVVSELASGVMLRVDAEGGGWARVSYPAGVPAVVKAADVRDVGAGELELTRANGLWALSAARGFSGSWQRLVPPGQELKTGSRLRVIEAIQRPSGPIEGYLVVAPDVARGFVELTALRRATAAEVAALGVAPAESAPAEPAPVESGATRPAEQDPDTGASATTSAEPPSNDPLGAASSDASANAAESVLLTEEMVIPTPDAGAAVPQDAPPAVPATEGAMETATPSGVATPSVSTPSVSTQSTPTGMESMSPVGHAAASATTEQPAAAPRTGMTIAQLESAFEAVRRQPTADAELDELIAEYRRVMAGAEVAPSTRAALQRRVDVLQLQADMRERTRTFEEQRAAIRDGEGEVAARVAAARQTGGYLLVGRLVPSIVYDGTRVPLMYRVVSVGATAPRTLAYLQPDDRFELDGKVGRVVGVSGNELIDPTLRLRMIQPARVDVLRADAGVP